MRRFVCVFAVGVTLFVLGACRSQQPETIYRPTATIKDIMDSMVDPSADLLWNSVATVVSAAGTEERQPRTDEEWTEVRRAAIRIVEATNLLIMPGRHVARPGEKSENPKVELEPEEMEKMINADRAAWSEHVGHLYEEATAALKAIDAKNIQGITDAGEKLDTACENCHLKYWYPGQLTEFKNKQPETSNASGKQ
jgi:hypothetical protein